jgi:hypothetical protein
MENVKIMDVEDILALVLKGKTEIKKNPEFRKDYTCTGT